MVYNYFLTLVIVFNNYFSLSNSERINPSGYFFEKNALNGIPNLL